MTESAQIALMAMVGTVVAQIPAIILALNNRKQVSDTKAEMKQQLLDTKQEVTSIKDHVDGNTDKLIQSNKDLYHAAGRADGLTEAMDKIVNAPIAAVATPRDPMERERAGDSGRDRGKR